LGLHQVVARRHSHVAATSTVSENDCSEHRAGDEHRCGRRGADQPPAPRAATRLFDQGLQLLRRLRPGRGFDDHYEMKLVVLAPLKGVKEAQPPARGMPPADRLPKVDGSGWREW